MLNTKLLVADDHDLVRDTVAAYLANGGGFETRTAVSLDDAIARVEEEGAFDLVLLDYTMPGMNGLDGLARMTELNGPGTVAILSGNASAAVAREAVDAGAIGFLPKTITGKSLVHAINFMLAGETYMPMSVMRDAEEPPPLHPLAKLLSERELQVLAGLAQGLSNKEIARDLVLQEVTVKLHVKTLSRKLNARNRTHAAMIAKDAGIV